MVIFFSELPLLGNRGQTLRWRLGFQLGWGAGFVGGAWKWTGFYPLFSAVVALYAISLILLGVAFYKNRLTAKLEPSELIRTAIPISIGAAIAFLATLYFIQLVFLVLIVTAPIIVVYQLIKASRFMDSTPAPLRHLVRNMFRIIIVMAPLLFIAAFVTGPAVNSIFLALLGWALANSILGLIAFARFLKERKLLSL